MNLRSPAEGLVTDGGDKFVTECASDESIVQAVIRGIATVKGVDPTDLEPLYREIEPEALEALMTHADELDYAVGVEFTFDGYAVLVRSGGRIRIDEGPPRTIPDPADD